MKWTSVDELHGLFWLALVPSYTCYHFVWASVHSFLIKKIIGLYNTRALFHKTGHIYDLFEVIIYDLFEVVYYDLIYGTGLCRLCHR